MHYSKKYLWQEVLVKMDRPMGSKHPKWGYIYPVNYGFIPDTKAPDGEELDVYVLWVFEPKQEFKWECIAIIHRIDDEDDKLVVVPKWKNYTDEQIQALVEFQERFFNYEIIRN